MEIFSPLNQVVQAAHAARLPVFKPPDPNRINAGETAARAEADTSPMSHNDANSALIRTAGGAGSPKQAGDSATGADATGAGRDAVAADRLQPEDPDRPAGPPPAFEVSLLERALDFEQTMARLEVRRHQAEDARAVRPDPARSSAPAAPPGETAASSGTDWRAERTGEGQPSGRDHAAPDTPRAGESLPAPASAVYDRAQARIQALVRYQGPQVPAPGGDPG